MTDGEVDDRSSADVVEIAYVIDDADIRVPQFAVHIERDPSVAPPAKPSSRASSWTLRPGLPSWFAAFKPATPVPIKWPSGHLELGWFGLRGAIVNVTGDKKTEAALGAAALACMQASTQ